MISSTSSTTASSGHHAARRDARIADLTKQVAELREELATAKDTKPRELAGLKSNAIAQDIASTQAQIEKVALESQLSRLNLISSAAESPSISKNSHNSQKTPDLNLVPNTSDTPTAGSSAAATGAPDQDLTKGPISGLPADAHKHRDGPAHKLYQDASGVAATHGSLVNLQA